LEGFLGAINVDESIVLIGSARQNTQIIKIRKRKQIDRLVLNKEFKCFGKLNKTTVILGSMDGLKLVSIVDKITAGAEFNLSVGTMQQIIKTQASDYLILSAL
jgi:hypothetical protein